MPVEPEPAATTTWEVVSIDAAANLATVRFENPYYSGAHIVERTRPVLDAEGQPTGEDEAYQADEDPNPHAIKTVRVPLTPTGGVDQPAFVERLNDQACGVRKRMEAKRAEQLAQGLGDLVGMTTPST
jgi:hypothetical protein